MSGLVETAGLPEVPLRLLIGGEWCEAASGERFATLNPANEQVLGRFPKPTSRKLMLLCRPRVTRCGAAPGRQ
jgi:hypothetical protein